MSGLLTSLPNLPLPNLLRLSASSPLAVSKINFEHYSRLLGYPTWNQFLQFIDYTRSFDRGLELGLLLLTAHEQFKDQIPQEDLDRNAASLHALVLWMLDKLDCWDEFIEAYDQILEHTNLSFGGYYAEDSRAHHLQNGAGPFLIGNVPGGFRLHFLYGLKNRREVIQRKIDRREHGKKLGNLYHARQSDLTEAELQERVDWLLKFFSSGIYDFDPPASGRHRSSFSMESHDGRMKPPTNAMRTRSAADQRATCRPS